MFDLLLPHFFYESLLFTTPYLMSVMKQWCVWFGILEPKMILVKFCDSKYYLSTSKEGSIPEDFTKSYCITKTRHFCVLICQNSISLLCVFQNQIFICVQDVPKSCRAFPRKLQKTLKPLTGYQNKSRIQLEALTALFALVLPATHLNCMGHQMRCFVLQKDLISFNWMPDDYSLVSCSASGSKMDEGLRQNSTSSSLGQIPKIKLQL